MKQNEALDIVREFLETHGLDGSGNQDEEKAQQKSDEGEGEDLFAGGDPNLAFRYFPNSGDLKCYALIYQFSENPRSGILDACEEEAKKKSTKMGGGQLEYDAEDKGLYLTRSYNKLVPVSQLTKDLQDLQAASVFWAEDVLDRVASRVFHPEELSS